MSATAPLDLEILHMLHDCGSDDGTAQWLAEEQGVQAMFSDGPTPPGKARNLAARACSSELLMALDDDDLLLQRTAYHFARALSDEGWEWAVSDFLKIDQDGRYLPGEDYYGWEFESPNEMLRAIFSGRHFIQGNACFTRDLFERCGGYAEEMKTAEDLELYTRFVLEAGLPRYLPMASHLHRMHGGNLSRTVDKDHYNRDLEIIYDKHRSELERRGISLELIP